MKPKILITILIITILFTACGSNVETPSKTDTNNTETTTSVIDYMETLPVKNYDGYTFTVIGYHIPDRVVFPADEETGEPLNDSLYRRNTMLEERYNINIVNVPFPDRGTTTTAVRKSVMAQDNAYDLIVHALGDGLNYLAMEGSLYDMCNIDYLQLDQNWWCKSMFEYLSVNGKLFYSSGPIAPFFYNAPNVFVYNKKLTEDHNMGDMNKLVLNNEWTIDKMLELVKDKNRDLNGDGIMHKDHDFFGMAVHSAPQVFIAAFGQKMTVLDKDLYFKLNFENEAVITLIDKIKEFTNDPNSTYNGAVNYVQYEEIPSFMENRMLFFIAPMGNVTNNFRSMEADYGILPVPKLNSAQANFHSYATPFGPVGAGVPVYCDNPERTGLITETMAYLSYEMVKPTMYDNILRMKIARDEESQQMLDLVYSEIIFDLNEMHNFGGSLTLLRDYAFSGKGDFVSGYAAIKDKAEAEIQALIDAYMKVS